MPSGAPKPAEENTGENLSIDDVKAKAGELKAKAADVVETVKQQANDIKQRATYSAKHSRESAADLMDTAASTISERASDLDRDSNLRSAALQGAGAIQGGADYLRTHGAADMISDAGDFVMDHPALSLVGAVFAGFLIGYAVFRD